MKYVVKLVGLPDVLVEDVNGRQLQWQVAGVLEYRDVHGEFQWAFAPGQWKSVHKMVEAEPIR